MRRALVGLAMVMALCLGAGTASATTVCVGGTCAGGAFTLTAPNAAVDFHGVLGGLAFTCSDSQISGVAPATAATTVSIPVTLSYSGCGAFGTNGSVSVPAACQDQITLKLMYTQATAPQATASLTIPSGCTITVVTPVARCQFTVSGERTIGATSGVTWTNGVTGDQSRLTLANALVSPFTVEPGSSPFCSSALTEMTLLGTYSVASPGLAPGVTVLP